jgi:hypothetical protein
MIFAVIACLNPLTSEPWGGSFFLKMSCYLPAVSIVYLTGNKIIVLLQSGLMIVLQAKFKPV